MLVFSLFFYAITASAPMLGDVTWVGATRVTTCWWLTAFGGSCQITSGAGTASSGSLQLMPLGFTLIVLYALYQMLRRRGVIAASDVATVALVQALVVAVIGAAVRPAGSWWIAIFGAAGLGAITAAWAGRRALFGARLWWQRCDPLLAPAARLGKLLAAYAGITLLLGVLVGARAIIGIHASYLAGFWGGLGLVLIQLLYLPTVLMWVLSWLLGAGFAIGEGTYFSIFGTRLQPLPAIPIFGALVKTNAWAALALIPVAIGIAILAWREVRRAFGQGSTAAESAAASRGRENSETTTEAASEVLAAPIVTPKQPAAESKLGKLAAEVEDPAAVPQPEQPANAPDSVVRVAQNAAIVIVIVTVVLAVLGWLTRGALGGGRMAVLGTRPELLVPAALLTIGIPYVGAAALTAWRFSKQKPAAAPSAKLAAAPSAKEAAGQAALPVTRDAEQAEPKESSAPAFSAPTSAASVSESTVSEAPTLAGEAPASEAGEAPELASPQPSADIEPPAATQPPVVTKPSAPEADAPQ